MPTTPPQKRKNNAIEQSINRWDSPLTNRDIQRNALAIAEANLVLANQPILTKIGDKLMSPFRNPLQDPPKKELQDPVTLEVFGSPTAATMSEKERKKRRVSFRKGFAMEGTTGFFRPILPGEKPRSLSPLKPSIFVPKKKGKEDDFEPKPRKKRTSEVLMTANGNGPRSTKKEPVILTDRRVERRRSKRLKGGGVR